MSHPSGITRRKVVAMGVIYPWQPLLSNQIAGTVELCKALAIKNGVTVFGLQNKGNDCFASSVIAQYTYKSLGPATNCENGLGGGWALDVYEISCGK